MAKIIISLLILSMNIFSQIIYFSEEHMYFGPQPKSDVSIVRLDTIGNFKKRDLLCDDFTVTKLGKIIYKRGNNIFLMKSFFLNTAIKIYSSEKGIYSFDSNDSYCVISEEQSTSVELKFPIILLVKLADLSIDTLLHTDNHEYKSIQFAHGQNWLSYIDDEYIEGTDSIEKEYLTIYDLKNGHKTKADSIMSFGKEIFKEFLYWTYNDELMYCKEKETSKKDEYNEYYIKYNYINGKSENILRPARIKKGDFIYNPPYFYYFSWDIHSGEALHRFSGLKDKVIYRIQDKGNRKYLGMISFADR